MGRRKFYRHTLPLGLPVMDCETSLFIGVIRNISLNGFHMQGTSDDMEEGKRLRVHITGDKQYGGSIECEFEVPVRCVWIHEAKDEYRAGFEYVELSEETLVALRKLIEQIHPGETQI